MLIDSAGGLSGRDWHGTSLGRRTAAILTRVVDGPVVTVESSGDPDLAAVLDRLAAEAPETEVALVCSANRPFLHPAVPCRILDLLGDADAAVPVVEGRRCPSL